MTIRSLAEAAGLLLNRKNICVLSLVMCAPLAGACGAHSLEQPRPNPPRGVEIGSTPPETTSDSEGTLPAAPLAPAAPATASTHDDVSYLPRHLLPPPGKLDLGPHGEKSKASNVFNPSDTCLLFRGCDHVKTISLPQCSEHELALDQSEVRERVGELLGKRIAVYGVLRPGTLSMSTPLKCGSDSQRRNLCCNDDQVALALGDGELSTPAEVNLLGMDVFACRGDHSMICCNSSDVGSTVIVHGVLDQAPSPEFLVLRADSACVVPP